MRCMKVVDRSTSVWIAEFAMIATQPHQRDCQIEMAREVPLRGPATSDRRKSSEPNSSPKVGKSDASCLICR
jgi:hypothetical protein